MKFKKGDLIIESKDENTFNLYERYGFVPVTDEKPEEPKQETAKEPEKEPDDTAELLAKAKELGIRNAHSMKRETLLKKIAEAEGAGE